MSISMVANQAQEASQHTIKSRETADSGADVILATVQGIQTISDSVRQTSTRIDALRNDRENEIRDRALHSEQARTEMACYENSLGKVKMIYIDPPYNTGNDFIYPDNYSESLDTYLAYTGQVDDEGRKFSTNTETDGCASFLSLRLLNAQLLTMALN